MTTDMAGIIDDLHRLLSERGITGQLELRTEHGVSTRWMGQPTEADVDVVVIVTGPPKQTLAEAMAIEEEAERIYSAMPYDGPAGTKKPAWQPGGNSHKQQEARSLARTKLAV
jgi:hypothetical protein